MIPRAAARAVGRAHRRRSRVGRLLFALLVLLGGCYKYVPVEAGAPGLARGDPVRVRLDLASVDLEDVTVRNIRSMGRRGRPAQRLGADRLGALARFRHAGRRVSGRRVDGAAAARLGRLDRQAGIRRVANGRCRRGHPARYVRRVGFPGGHVVRDGDRGRQRADPLARAATARWPPAQGVAEDGTDIEATLDDIGEEVQFAVERAPSRTVKRPCYRPSAACDPKTHETQGVGTGLPVDRH